MPGTSLGQFLKSFTKYEAAFTGDDDLRFEMVLAAMESEYTDPDNETADRAVVQKVEVEGQPTLKIEYKTDRTVLALGKTRITIDPSELLDPDSDLHKAVMSYLMFNNGEGMNALEAAYGEGLLSDFFADIDEKETETEERDPLLELSRQSSLTAEMIVLSGIPGIDSLPVSKQEEKNARDTLEEIKTLMDANDVDYVSASVGDTQFELSRSVVQRNGLDNFSFYQLQYSDPALFGGGKIKGLSGHEPDNVAFSRLIAMKKAGETLKNSLTRQIIEVQKLRKAEEIAARKAEEELAREEGEKKKEAEKEQKREEQEREKQAQKEAELTSKLSLFLAFNMVRHKVVSLFIGEEKGGIFIKRADALTKQSAIKVHKQLRRLKNDKLPAVVARQIVADKRNPSRMIEKQLSREELTALVARHPAEFIKAWRQSIQELKEAAMEPSVGKTFDREAEKREYQARAIVSAHLKEKAASEQEKPSKRVPPREAPPDRSGNSYERMFTPEEYAYGDKLITDLIRQMDGEIEGQRALPATAFSFIANDDDGKAKRHSLVIERNYLYNEDDKSAYQAVNSKYIFKVDGKTYNANTISDKYPLFFKAKDSMELGALGVAEQRSSWATISDTVTQTFEKDPNLKEISFLYRTGATEEYHMRVERSKQEDGTMQYDYYMVPEDGTAEIHVYGLEVSLDAFADFMTIIADDGDQFSYALEAAAKGELKEKLTVKEIDELIYENTIHKGDMEQRQILANLHHEAEQALKDMEYNLNMLFDENAMDMDGFVSTLNRFYAKTGRELTVSLDEDGIVSISGEIDKADQAYTQEILESARIFLGKHAAEIAEHGRKAATRAAVQYSTRIVGDLAVRKPLNTMLSAIRHANPALRELG